MKKRDNLPLNYKERLNSRTSFLVSIAVLVVLCLVFNQMDYTMIRQPAAQAKKAADLQKQKEEEAAATTQEVTTATVLAVGDNLVQPSLLASGQSETGAWNYDSVYANLKSDIQAADIAMVNQETPFTTDHSAVSGTAPYATPTEIGDALVNAGFNVVTSATALIDDNGSSMINETLNYWETSHPDVTLVGIHKNQSGIDTPKIVEINGIKIAFLNYTFPSYGSQTVSSGDSTDSSDGSANDSASSDTSGSSTGDADSSGSTDTSTSGKGSMIDTFSTADVAAAIKQAKASADCVIFSANWGKTEEPMPTEYEKEWANFLMEQGVDVVIGTNPNVLQPYGYLTDDSGHNMLIYYSLGNFVTGQETLKQLLGGMAAFTIQKTVDGDQTSIQIQDATLTPLVMHYSYDTLEYAPYKLDDYTDALASAHSVRQSIGDEFSLENLQTKYDEIMSMNVTPSTKTNLLDVTFDSDGNMLDSNGNYVEDNDSITSSWYYQTLATQSSSSSDGSGSGNSGSDFLMEQGVDVVIGTNPNVLQPYGYLTDDSGHNMLIYYSLGNFVTGQETLKQLLGGMAAFTIQKTVDGDQTSIQIQDATLTPLVMHYSYDTLEYAPYKLDDYTDALASAHSVRQSIGDEFSLENLQTKYDEIMSMNVTPSTKTNLLDVTFDSDGNMLDSNGNYVEDNDSITSSWYYQTLATQSSSSSDGSGSDHSGADASDDNSEG